MINKPSLSEYAEHLKLSESCYLILTLILKWGTTEYCSQPRYKTFKLKLIIAASQQRINCISKRKSRTGKLEVFNFTQETIIK